MILNSHVGYLNGPMERPFDLFLNSTGYEKRASALVGSGRISATKFVSLLFDHHRELCFDENQRILQSVNAEFISDSVQYCRSRLPNVVKQFAEQVGRGIRVGIDLSSMNRTMAATALASLFANREWLDELRIFYVPARFVKPQLVFSPIQQIGAVTPELSGFDSDPALPISLVMGLGYEFGTALGIINQLEPQSTICLKATGHDPRFDVAVKRANLDFDFSNYNVTISEYDLMDIKSAYQHIESIVYSLLGNFRVVLVPMGPKIFAALLVLVSLKYFGRVALWRVARPAEPTSSLPDEKYVSATIDLFTESQGLDFGQLKKMISGQELEFLSV